jgi:hypothetical protein
MKTRCNSKKKVGLTEAGKKEKLSATVESKVMEREKKSSVTKKVAGSKKESKKNTKCAKVSSKSSKIVNSKTKKIEGTPIAKSPFCVVVYSTGVYEHFRTEKMARKQRSALPDSVVAEYRMFATKDEATEFTDGTYYAEDKKRAAKPALRIVTPSKGTTCFGNPDEMFTSLNANQNGYVFKAPPARLENPNFGNPNANLPLKALNKISGSKLDCIKFSENGSIGVTGNLALSSVDSAYLASVKSLSTEGLVEIQVHVFKFPFEPVPKYQVVTFELYDLKQQKTYWIHHPDKWEQLFQNAKKLGCDQLYDEVCYNFHSFVMRNVTTGISGLQNEPWMREGKPRDDGSKFIIEMKGLYALFPFEHSHEEIKDDIRLFGMNALKPVAMEAYSSIHLSKHPAVVDSLAVGVGTYWLMLESAIAGNIKIIEEDTLDNMFRDEEIRKFMVFLFNEKNHPRNYENANLINYAYGRITAHDAKN